MNTQSLDQLIAKVKTEAIDAAQQEAQRIIASAKQEAARLLTQATTEKQQLLNTANTEAKATLAKGKIALEHAARDVQITVKNDIIKLLASVLEAELDVAFTPELYQIIISKVIDTLGANVTIALPEALEAQISAAVRKRVADAKDTINIIADKQLFSGLSITKTNEGWHYDITPEEITNLLSQHLNKKWIDSLNTK